MHASTHACSVEIYDFYAWNRSDILCRNVFSNSVGYKHIFFFCPQNRQMILKMILFLPPKPTNDSENGSYADTMTDNVYVIHTHIYTNIICNLNMQYIHIHTYIHTAVLFPKQYPCITSVCNTYTHMKQTSYAHQYIYIHTYTYRSAIPEAASLHHKCM